MFDYDSFPSSHMIDGLKLYFEEKIAPGSFMTAVLSNDLKEACARADFYNQDKLYDIVRWLYNEAPSTSWGSPEKVNKWLQGRSKIVEEKTLTGGKNG